MTQDTWGWRISRAKLNQEDFAQRADISYATLKSYLRVKPAEPSKSNFDKIEETLKEIEDA